MKTASLVARLLLGLVFLVFGLNGFLRFIPQGPMPDGPAARFIGVLTETHYVVPVFLLQIVAGALFLAGRYVPLALVLIAPVIVNILLFHALMAPSGILPGIIVTVLWFIVAFHARLALAGLLQKTLPPEPGR